MLHSTVFEILCLLRIVEYAMELIKPFYFFKYWEGIPSHERYWNAELVYRMILKYSPVR